MATSTVRLLDLDPELARYVPAEDRTQAERLVVPVLTLPRGRLDLNDRLKRSRAFGAVLVEGMLLQRMRLANHVTMKLQGPGDIVGRVAPPAEMLLSEWTMTVTEATQMALLGNEFLGAARRWPGLTAGLHVRLYQQGERLAVQLAICQLPRVDERLLALLWWLAEAWGRVTPVGTVLPISMTHDVLGALVGARRPTVTLALGELSERGAIVRQDRGWLLLEPPPVPSRSAETFDDPALLSHTASAWTQPPTRGEESEENAHPQATAHVELLDTVNHLRAENRAYTQQVRARLAQMVAARGELAARRAAAPERLTPPPGPSS